jgi:hypothetical protein
MKVENHDTTKPGSQHENATSVFHHPKRDTRIIPLNSMEVC